MAYTAEISRAHPSCILFLIDQSGSMSEEFEAGVSKASFLSDVLNRNLLELSVKCRKAEGVLYYFDIGVIAYSGSGVGPGLGGSLTGAHLCDIPTLADSPVRVEERKKRIPDGAGGVVETTVRFPIWFDPQASGGTPMCSGLQMAGDLLADWCREHPYSFPPTVLHVTDGEATDGSEAEVEAAAAHVTRQATNDGNVLLMNLHVSPAGGEPISYPSNENSLPSSYARLLFRTSSLMPPEFRRRAGEVGITLREGSRAYVYNARINDVVGFFDIGTRPRLLGGDR